MTSPRLRFSVFLCWRKQWNRITSIVALTGPTVHDADSETAPGGIKIVKGCERCASKAARPENRRTKPMYCVDGKNLLGGELPAG
jgi:hypothetical protein